VGMRNGARYISRPGRATPRGPVPPTSRTLTVPTPPSVHAETHEVEAELTLFGFPATPARVFLRPRSRSWRLWGALRSQGVGLILAPAVGLVPPHAPWALGALGVGFLLARRRWRHFATVEKVIGQCPKCGTTVSPRPAMMRQPHPVPCEGCHHELTLVFPEESREQAAGG